MKLGTPGFVGPRLREAREARGLTAAVLGELLGVSKAAVSQYEIGQTSPTPDVLRNICTVLNQPPGFFLRQPVRGDHTVFFRSQSGITVAARRRAGIRLDWLADIVQELANRLRFPAVRFHPVDPPSDPMKLGWEHIDEIADETRRYWGLGMGPISNVVWLLENNGAIITRGEIDEEHMDSFSRYDETDRFPFIVLNGDKSSAVRSRFNAAHELGHCILHRAVPREYWSNEMKVKMREKQADRFASAFLLPAESFTSEIAVPSIETFLALKPKWKTSIQAMLHRCQETGLITPEHAERVWRSIGRRKIKTIEPLDGDLPFEMPRLLPKAIEALSKEHPHAAAMLVDAIDLSPSDVAVLTMVPVERLLSDLGPNIVPFPTRTA